MESKHTPAERTRDQNEPGTVTAEVGSEGGSPGDIEFSDRTGTSTGSEAGEWAGRMQQQGRLWLLWPRGQALPAAQ